MGFLKNFSISKKLFLIVLLLSIFIVGLACFFFYEIGRIHIQFDKNIPSSVEEMRNASKLDSQAQFIRYYDEVLTQSARNYAFTGDKKWLNRYEENVPKLDEMIKAAISNGDQEDKSLFESIDESNRSLIEMETSSQSAVKSGNKDLAISILESVDYLNQKKIYSDALANFAEKRGANYDDAIQTSTEVINRIAATINAMIVNTEMFGTFIFLIIIILTIMIGISLTNSITKPIAELKDATTLVSAGNLDINLPAEAKDEIGQLATNFNAMVLAVKESRASIDRKVAEQTKTIKEAQIKDEAYLESIGDGVIAVDENENIILANLQAEFMLGYSKDELMGKKFSALIGLLDKDGKPLPVEKRPIREVLASGKKKIFTDYSYVKKDKTNFQIALTTAPLILEGEIIGAIDVFRDITKEKQIDKAKTEFVSLASHQLRTPLSAVNWYAEMLIAGDAGKLSKEQLKYVKEIYDGNQRMVDLVNALLDVSRIELGTFAIEPKKTDIKEIGQSVAKEMLPSVKQKNQTLLQDYEKNLPKLMVDPKLIRIVLQNLLSNAVKYTPQKGRVKIAILKKSPNLLIKVFDTGFGIPKKQQNQIFTKLFRADNIRQKDTEGTGLGLYIVKSIIEQSGGRIWFESEENKGTKFYVQIPLKGMIKKEGTKALEDIK